MSNNFLQYFHKNFDERTTLDKAKLNAHYIIISCNLPQKLQKRFEELGFVEGTEVTVVKVAPLGDPLEVRVLGYSLCARANELKHITVARSDRYE